MNNIKKIILVICLFPSICLADLIKVDFTASISGITEYLGEISTETRGDYNFHNNTFSLAQSITGFLIYDTTSEQGSTLKDDPTSDIYSSVIDFEISFGTLGYNLNGWPYQFEHRGYSIICNDQESSIRDVASFSSPLFYTQPISLGDGDEIASATMRLFDRDGNAVSSTKLPTELDLSDFEYKNISFLQFTRYGSSFTRRFLFMDSTLTSLSFSNITTVNEPKSLYLMLTLLVAGMVFRRFC
jgi:hypothetical protein